MKSNYNSLFLNTFSTSTTSSHQNPNDNELSISIIIDNHYKETFKLTSKTAINRYCSQLLTKYKIDTSLKPKLIEQITNHINLIKLRQKSLSLKEEEIVQRLYNQGISYKERHLQKIEKLKEQLQNEENKHIYFSPRISYKSKILKTKDTKPKNTKYIYEIQRIINKDNEMKECHQFTKHNDIKEQITKQQLPKAIKYNKKELQIKRTICFSINSLKHKNTIHSKDSNNHKSMMHHNNTLYRTKQFSIINDLTKNILH